MNEQTNFEKGRVGAMAFGGVVYVGVVIAATTLFISFVLTAFPSDAYFSRFIMVIGGLMIGGSMLAFPIALHTWAISGKHRAITIGLYYTEMAIIATNTVVSFAALLYTYAGTQLPSWVAWYEPFSIVSIIFTLFAWGTIFLTDPSAKAKEKELKAEQDFKNKVSDKLLEYLDSIEGEDAIQQAADAEIASKFKPRQGKKHFGTTRVIPAPALFINESTTDGPATSGNKFRD